MIPNLSLGTNAGRADGIDATADIRSAAIKSDELNTSGKKENYIRASELKTIEAVASAIAIGSLGDSSAFRSSGTTQGMGVVATADATLKLGMTNPDGSLDANNEKAKNFMRGTKAQTAEKLSATIGHGSTVDIDKAINKGFDDGTISGESSNKIDEERKLLKKLKDGDLRKWSAKNIASGNAISAVHKETAAQGVHNALALQKGNSRLLLKPFSIFGYMSLRSYFNLKYKSNFNITKI